MNRILLLIFLVIAFVGTAQGATIAYVVNNDTTYANLTYDRQWIDFFTNDMGYTVKVITDDSAGAITSVNNYDGYFLSATMTSANLTNLLSTTKGVVICDQLMYDDFLVATGQTAATLLTDRWILDRSDSTHAVTKYMFNKIMFSYASNSASYGYTGIADGATVLFNPSNKNWTGALGTPDTAFCYVIETGANLTTGTAAGRRAVALPFYALLTSTTDAGWCHPYELMGNIAGWAWNDSANAYNSGYNCYSTDRATDPGPEVREAWAEWGSNWRYVYYGGRTGDDGMMGLLFLALHDWSRKAMVGMEPDSFRFTYTIPYRSFGTDAPPTLTDSITLATIVSSTRLTYDTTTLSRSYFDLKYCGASSRGIVVRSGSGADTVQKGDTITLAGGSRSGTNDTLYYARTGAGFFNGTTGTVIRLSIVDPFGGSDFWLKFYAITRNYEWTTPLAYLNEGGNPEGHATRTWINRNYIVNGATGAVAWDDSNLTPGVDHEAAAVDSVQMNISTFTADGGTFSITVPGSYLNDPDFRWLVGKSLNVGARLDSTDVEIVPSSIDVVRGSTIQQFEVFMSAAVPLTIAVDSAVLHVSGEVDGDAQFLTNYVRNSGDGVMLIDAVTDNQSWVTQTVGGSGGSTPLLVEHAISMAGTAGTDTATITVAGSTASNTPQTYLIIRTLTEPSTPVPPATVEKRTGLRRQ